MSTRPFAPARAYARTLHLRSKRAWRAWARSPARPPDLPLYPEKAYRRHGWVSWYDWLGHERTGPTWRPFAQARTYAQGLHLGSVGAWRAWSQTGARPHDIPSNPNLAYRDAGWQGWGDWLGTGRRRVTARTALPFAEARTYARRLGLPSAEAWHAWAKTPARPPTLPVKPNVVYRHQGWVDWADWLGPRYGTARPSRFRAFAQARAYVHTLGLRSSTDWFRWAATAARPRDIPSNPARPYWDAGWAGFPDWLGTGPLRP